MDSQLRDWIGERTKREPLYESHAESALRTFKELYERHEQWLASVADTQAPCPPLLLHEGGRPAPESLPPEIREAWVLNCDPSELADAERSAIDELIDVNARYKQQLDVNLSLRRDIQRLCTLTRDYERATHVDAIDAVSAKIPVLRKKQEEYGRLLRERKGFSEDVGVLAEVVRLVKERDELDKQLQHFHHLPPSLPDALMAIASAEAELQQVEEQLALLL